MINNVKFLYHFLVKNPLSRVQIDSRVVKVVLKTKESTSPPPRVIMSFGKWSIKFPKPIESINFLPRNPHPLYTNNTQPTNPIPLMESSETSLAQHLLGIVNPRQLTFPQPQVPNKSLSRNASVSVHTPFIKSHIVPAKRPPRVLVPIMLIILLMDSSIRS